MRCVCICPCDWGASWGQRHQSYRRLRATKCGCWEPNSGCLQGQKELLTPAPSSRPLWSIFPAPLILFFLMYSGLLFPIFGEKFGYGTLDFLGSSVVNDRWFLSLIHFWLQALSYQTPQLLSVAEIYFIQTNKANGLFSYALLSWVIILPLTHFGFSVSSFPACYNFLSGASLT